MIVTCSEDFTARLWDVSGKPLSRPLRHKNQVRWAAFNESDEWLATTGWDQTVIVWSTRTGVPLTPPMNLAHTLEHVSFNGDYQLIVSSSVASYEINLPPDVIDPAQILRNVPAHPELLDAR